MNLPARILGLLILLAGCKYTEEDYLIEWIDLNCKEVIDKCDQAEDFACGEDPMECCREEFMAEAERQGEDLVSYYMPNCESEYDAKKAKACLAAWEEIIDENECLDGTGDEGITDPPECENVCIPGLG